MKIEKEGDYLTIETEDDDASFLLPIYIVNASSGSLDITAGDRRTYSFYIDDAILRKKEIMGILSKINISL